MAISEEALLMIFILALYLYDSTMLLYCNEGVLISASKGWNVRFGFRDTRIRGRELFIPAPWLPHRQMYRLAWKFEGNSPRARLEDWNARKKLPLQIAALVWITAFAMFVVLPLGLFSALGHRALLGAVLLIYLSIVSMLTYMWFQRNGMNLTKKQVGKLAFEYLTCPPFALNVVRRLSSEQEVVEDLVTAARRLQVPDRWALTRQQLALRLDEEIELEEEGTERMAALQEHRLKLTGETRHEHD